jgi:hypothetical protein
LFIGGNLKNLLDDGNNQSIHFHLAPKVRYKFIQSKLFSISSLENNVQRDTKVSEGAPISFQVNQPYSMPVSSRESSFGKKSSNSLQTYLAFFWNLQVNFCLHHGNFAKDQEALKSQSLNGTNQICPLPCWIGTFFHKN